MWKLCGLGCCPYGLLSLVVPAVALVAAAMFSFGTLRCNLAVSEDGLDLGYWTRQKEELAGDGVTIVAGRDCQNWDDTDSFDFQWKLGKAMSILGTLACWTAAMGDCFLVYTGMPIWIIWIMVFGHFLNAVCSGVVLFVTDSDVCHQYGCSPGRGVDLVSFAVVLWCADVFLLCCVGGIERRYNHSARFVRQHHIQMKHEQQEAKEQARKDAEAVEAEMKRRRKRRIKDKDKDKDRTKNKRLHPDPCNGDNDSRHIESDRDDDLPTTIGFVDKQLQQSAADNNNNNNGSSSSKHRSSVSSPSVHSDKSTGKRRRKLSQKHRTSCNTDLSECPSKNKTVNTSQSYHHSDNENSNNANRSRTGVPPSSPLKSPRSPKRKKSRGSNNGLANTDKQHTSPRRKKSGVSQSASSSQSIPPDKINDDNGSRNRRSNDTGSVKDDDNRSASSRPRPPRRRKSSTRSSGGSHKSSRRQKKKIVSEDIDADGNIQRPVRITPEDDTENTDARMVQKQRSHTACGENDHCESQSQDEQDQLLGMSMHTTASEVDA